MSKRNYIQYTPNNKKQKTLKHILNPANIKYSDVSICCNGKYYKSSKCILAYHSDVFETQLENKSDTVHIPDRYTDIIGDFVKFTHPTYTIHDISIKSIITLFPILFEFNCQIIYLGMVKKICMLVPTNKYFTYVKRIILVILPYVNELPDLQKWISMCLPYYVDDDLFLTKIPSDLFKSSLKLYLKRSPCKKLIVQKKIIYKPWGIEF